MPLTFPSHAAAVLPLCRHGAWLPPSALIIGSAAPDFAYLLDTNRWNFHRWPEVFWPCLPIAFAAWWLYEGLIGPWLTAVVRDTWGAEAGVVAETRGVRTNLVGVVAALCVGALTHLAWDGLTHATRWPASVLYPNVRIGPMGLTHWLQLASHVIGLVPVMIVVRRMTPTTRWLRPAITAQLLQFAAILGLCEAASFTTLGVMLSNSSRVSLFSVPWLTFWWGARGFVVAVTLCALWYRRQLGSVSDRPARARSAPPA
ncbi:MAG: DUF4184 family protein [Archangium sp.]|nr:DUF4184 family protein [Archangium sp.]